MFSSFTFRPKAIVFCLACSWMISVQAVPIMADLDFTEGNWALVGVPVHNYKLLPIQQEMRTFITKDLSFLKSLKKDWDFNMTFEDNCDYHYSLKFYKDGHLEQTMKLNLHCGYITVNGFSYEFEPVEFERFRKKSEQISWSRITFGDLDYLAHAIKKLDKAEGVYWYEDIYHYTFPGFLLMSVQDLPWNTDLDSLYNEVQHTLQTQTGSDRFYLKKYYHLIRGDKMQVRYLVSCEEPVARNIDMPQTLKWRSHLSGKDSIRVVAIGVDERRYWEILKGD